jgi:hypothetical protein
MSDDPVVKEKKNKKPNKGRNPELARPEAANWSQSDAITEAAKKNQGGWHQVGVP